MRKACQAAAIMLAGGKGSRLHELTETTCKPALPLGPGSVIADWTLDNLRRSGITDLTVATQYRPARLEAHLRDRWAGHFATLRIANGIAMTGQPEGYAGTADAVRRVADLIEPARDTLLVVAADHVYDMNYGPMIRAHRDSGAGVTVACTIVPAAGAQAFGVVAADADGRIGAFVEKPQDPPEMPDQPGRCLVSMGLYVCDRDWLRTALARGGDDFGHDILPEAVRRGEAHAFRAVTPDGAPLYWEDVGTLDAYRRVSVELALNPWRCPQPRHPFARPCPVETAHWAQGGTVLLPGASVAPAAHVRNAIVAPDARIPASVSVGLCPEEDRRWFRVTPGGTTLVTGAMLERRAALVRRMPAETRATGRITGGRDRRAHAH